MIPAIATALISGGAGLLQNIFNNRAIQQNNQAQYKMNMDLAQYNWDRNYAMWNEQNLYNLPANQMQRLKEAGLNPNLVYGGGNVTGNTVGQPPQMNAQAPELQRKRYDLMSTLENYTDLRMKIATIDNIQEQIQATRQKRMNDVIVGQILGSNAQMKAQDALIHDQILDFNLQGKDLDNQIKTSKIQTMIAERGKIAEQTKLFTQQINKIIQEGLWMDKRNELMQNTGINLDGNDMTNTLMRFLYFNGMNLKDGFKNYILGGKSMNPFMF